MNSSTIPMHWSRGFFLQLPAAEFPKYFLNIQKTQVGVVKQKTETVSPIGWAGLDSSRAGLVEQALLESL